MKTLEEVVIEISKSDKLVEIFKNLPVDFYCYDHIENCFNAKEIKHSDLNVKTSGQTFSKNSFEVKFNSVKINFYRENISGMPVWQIKKKKNESCNISIHKTLNGYWKGNIYDWGEGYFISMNSFEGCLHDLNNIIKFKKSLNEFINFL